MSSSPHNFLEETTGANNLQGTFPVREVSLLSDLVGIYAGENNLTGPLDNALSNMDQIVSLDFHNNLITGTLPAMNQLDRLQQLYLWSNALSGPAQDITFPPNVIEMPLLDNVFFGRLPDSLGELQYARFVSFGRNMITGRLPTAIGDMLSLRIFDGKFCNTLGGYRQ
mmetsp:Transcript_34961/g.64386  ORF Transcript_34961/g.64386 Transcript_34961/m.64386 type:complete len:168 (-) Transcript_34961:684-1187(-)